MSQIMRFPSAVPRDPAVEAWFAGPNPELPSSALPNAELRRLVRPWFEQMRACGPDVCELIHDGQPTACLGDAAFAYVDAFTAHANLGFFHGFALPDPAGLLQGTGKRMRHVKLRPGEPVDAEALGALIAAAYRDVRGRL